MAAGLNTPSVRALSAAGVSRVILALTLSIAFSGAEVSHLAAQDRTSEPPQPEEEESESAPDATPVGETRTVTALGGIEIELIKGRASLTLEQIIDLQLLPAANTGGTLVAAERRWPLADVLFLRVRSSAVPIRINRAWILLLRNGDTVRGTITRGDEDAIGFLGASVSGSRRKIPFAAVRALITESSLRGEPGRLADTTSARARLIRRLQTLKPDEDIAVLRQEQSAGTGEGGRLTGIVETIANDAVRIGTEQLGNVELAYGKLKALVLADLGEDESKAPAADKATIDSKAQIHARLADESALTGSLTGLDAQSLALLHPVLGEVRVALHDVNSITFFGGQVTYLSDLEPSRTQEYPGPLFNETKRYTFKRDANVLYGPLRMQGRHFRKGLGVHSYSLLEYTLDQPYARFQATIGLDDSARPLSPQIAAADVASVVFRVKLDNELQYERTMTWKDTPVPVEVQVGGGKKLLLEVDFGGKIPANMNSTLDRANWAEARLVKEETR